MTFLQSLVIQGGPAGGVLGGIVSFDADFVGECIGAIYEAAALPELWPAAISRLSQIGGCQGGAILTSNEVGNSWVACDVIRPYLGRFAEEGWMAQNTRLEGLLAARTTSFVADLDIFTAEQIAEMPIYRDFYHRLGYGWGAATAIRSPSGDMMVVSLERQLASGPVSRAEIAALNTLRPHVARASLLASRLQLRRMEGTLQVLQSIGIPAALVGPKGRLQAANPAFESLSAAFTTRGQDRIALNDGAAARLLEAGLAAVHTDEGAQVRSIPVPARQETPAFVLHIAPVRRQMRDLFAQAQALLVAATATGGGGVEAGVLSGLYDLTPAEAAVAERLLAGARVSEIAARQKISAETVRTHVKRILVKTGCPSQIEFVRRLSPLAALSG